MQVGTTVLARVYRVLPTAAGMSVQLGNKDHGRIAATNIADKFSKTPFKGIKVGSVVQCHVISKTKRKGSNFWELSLRKSHLLGVGEVSDPVITSMADVEKDHVYRGYIVNTTDNGCYVCRGRCHLQHACTVSMLFFNPVVVYGAGGGHCLLPVIL